MGGHLSVVMLLCENGADIEARDNKNKSPLIHAVYHLHLQVVEYLLERGANTKNGALSTAIIWHGVSDSQPVKRNAVITALLKEGAIFQGNNGIIALGDAVKLEHLGAVKHLLAQRVDMNNFGFIHDSPLSIAVKMNSKEMMRYLLKRRADPYSTDVRGRTALSTACENGRFEAAQLLFQWCQEKDGSEGIKKLLSAKQLGYSTSVYGMELDSPLMKAIDSSFKDRNAKESEENLLQLESTKPSYYSIVKMFLKHRDDPNQTGSYGMSALASARKVGHTGIQALLMRHGAID